jgi:hypothetical protein
MRKDNFGNNKEDWMVPKVEFRKDGAVPTLV